MMIRFIALLSIAAVLPAHDMWIEPTAFRPAVGQIVGARLRVGQNLLGDPLPRDPALIREFVFDDGSGRRALVGREGSDPAGYLRMAGAGMSIVGYFSNPSRVELTAEKFNQYLQEEGLDAIAAVRVARKQTASGAREMFTRCAKSLIVSGAAGDGQADRALGFTLELVAERNPYTLRDGEELPVRLMYEGRPLAGALVVAMNRMNPAERVSVRTGSDGRARLKLRSTGMWMIKAVHMLAAPAGSNADWQSFWASLTFEKVGNE